LKYITLFLALAALTMAACSDDESTSSTSSSGGSGDCVDYSAVDINACSGGPCSFSLDVMPIFQQSCTLSAVCHCAQGDCGAAPKEDLSLGPKLGVAPTQGEIDQVHAAIVDQDSKRSSLKLVVPSDPGSSWLLAKVEYNHESGGSCQDPPCFSGCSLGCEPGTLGCGLRMPQTSPRLDEATRAVLRAWIADGAQNN
jgi:hypothetical protein